MLLFLESILRTRVKRTLLLNDKEEKDLVIVYIHFIINFLGRVKDGYLILQSYYEILADRSRSSMPEFADLDALMLKEIVKDLIQGNLETSKICYKIIEDHITDPGYDGDQARYFLSKMNLRHPIEFVNKIEYFKSEILAQTQNK
jgi:hypothetical protein